MRLTRRRSDVGRIDGGEGRGVRLGGSDTSAPATGTVRRRRRVADETFDDDETLIDPPGTFDDAEEFSDDNDAHPGDRRRDPLRKKI